MCDTSRESPQRKTRLTGGRRWTWLPRGWTRCTKKRRSEVRESWLFFFSSRRRHTIFKCDWSSDVCSSDLFLVLSTCLIRHFEDLRDGTHGGSASRKDKEAHFEKAVHLLAPVARQVLNEMRSEERRVGKECRSRWSPYH